MRKRWRTEDRQDVATEPGDAGSLAGEILTVRQALGTLAFSVVVTVAFLVSDGIPDAPSVRRHVDAAYARSPADDIGGDAVAYTSPLKPTGVAAEITDGWRPGRGVADADGVYLRYADDSIVILRRQNGSLILVEKTTTAYPRYLAHVAGHWDR
ncbi:DUF4247 domain-containing protein [Actinoplanes sp. NPDC049548]|uniref:DUF4247 domain-containing protein n=1 Tax=Actinoplanes sp. NPDC049548 TaxID=3155152 RepID=UPI00342CA24B